MGLSDPGSYSLAGLWHCQTGPTAAGVFWRTHNVHFPDISIFQTPNKSKYEINHFFFSFFSLMCKLLRVMSIKELNCYSIFFLPCYDILNVNSSITLPFSFSVIFQLFNQWDILFCQVWFLLLYPHPPIKHTYKENPSILIQVSSGQ